MTTVRPDDGFRAPTRDEERLTPERMDQLVREGQASRRRFDEQTAGMRRLTPDDLKVRCR